MDEEIDTDEILKGIEQPEAERPMSGPAEKPADAPPAPAAWNGEEFAFDWNGKRVIPDSREKLQTWASLGHNYSQRAAEINKREAEFKSLEGKYKPYAEVDDYASKNPEWWTAVQEAYAKRGEQVPQTVGQLDPAIQAALKPLQEQLAQVSSFMTSAQKEREQQDQARHDQALSAEVEAVRKQYPTIDLNAVDESGETLETRVFKHAAEIGTSSFRAAYRDYLHDQLVESAKANGQTAQVKAAEHAKRQGILGRSSTPKKVPDDAPANVRGKSYDQITADIYREFGINA